jgi:hypothetical protein
LVQRTASPGRTVVLSHRAFAHGHLDAGASRTTGLTFPPSENRPLKFSYRAVAEEGFGHFRDFGFDFAAVTYADAKEKRSQEDQNDSSLDPPNHNPAPPMRQRLIHVHSAWSRSSDSSPRSAGRRQYRDHCLNRAEAVQVAGAEQSCHRLAAQGLQRGSRNDRDIIVRDGGFVERNLGQ